jgi:hypothetical protein
MVSATAPTVGPSSVEEPPTTTIAAMSTDCWLVKLSGLTNPM